MAPNPHLFGRSFLWAFVLSLGLFAIAVLLFTRRNSLSIAFAVMAGAVPFLVQVLTGYGLDRRWVASFSRAEYPVKYTILLALSFAVMVWFGYVSWLATTPSAKSPPNISGADA